MKITKHIGWVGLVASTGALSLAAWDARAAVRESGVFVNPWFWVLVILSVFLASIPAFVGYWASRNPTGRRAEISLWVSGMFILNLFASIIHTDIAGIEARLLSATAFWIVAISILYISIQKIKMKTEPNKAMRRSRLLVTDPASAGSAPSNRLADLER